MSELSSTPVKSSRKKKCNSFNEGTGVRRNKKSDDSKRKHDSIQTCLKDERAMTSALKEEIVKLNFESRQHKSEKIHLEEKLLKLQFEYEDQEVVKSTLEEQTSMQRQSIDTLSEDKASNKRALAQRDERIRDLELNVLCLTDQLATSEAANHFRGGAVLTIPSKEIFLTDTKLGGGSYGEVRVARWLGCPVAVKMMYDELTESDRNIDLFIQEVTLSWRIHHPHVVSICGFVMELDDEKRNAWLVMELLQGTVTDVLDVSQKRNVQKLSLREIIDLAYDSLCGICYLHSAAVNILHGDIRPTNILVTSVMTAKLADLGAARLTDGFLSAGPMSPAYTAPERIDGRYRSKTKATDVFSVGVTICEIFTGLHPDRRTRFSQVQAVSNEDVKAVCKRMLQVDPSRRPNAVDVLTVMDEVRKTEAYKECPPKRMVKRITKGMLKVELTDSMW